MAFNSLLLFMVLEMQCRAICMLGKYHHCFIPSPTFMVCNYKCECACVCRSIWGYTCTHVCAGHRSACFQVLSTFFFGSSHSDPEVPS